MASKPRSIPNSLAKRVVLPGIRTAIIAKNQTAVQKINSLVLIFLPRNLKKALDQANKAKIVKIIFIGAMESRLFSKKSPVN